MENPLSAPEWFESPSPDCERKLKPPKLKTRRRLSVIAFLMGLAIFVYGCYLETRNPRTNAEDNVAWAVLGVGVSLASVGISLRFLHPKFAPIIAILAPPLVFCLAVVVFWICLIAFGLLIGGS